MAIDYSFLLSYIFFVFLWMASPGPCFAIVARNSTKFGIKAGIFTSLGIVTCDALFIFFAVIGVAEFLKLFPKVLEAGKMIGAGYIFYIGVDIFISTFKKKKNAEIDDTQGQNTPLKLFTLGFLTDASNPLLIIGMLAIVLGFIDLNASALHISFYSAIIPLTTVYVNFTIAFLFGNKFIRNLIVPYMNWFERFAGLLICTLAILVFFS